MARKRYSDEDALKILREIDVHLHDGLDVVSACRSLNFQKTIWEIVFSEKRAFPTRLITIGARSSGVWDGRSFPR